jgi:hypothetical protein
MWTKDPRYLRRSFIVDLEMPDGESFYGVPRDEYPDLVAKAVAWRPNEHNPWMFQDDKAIRYVKDGEYYRDDGPALIWNDGTKFWYENARCWKIQHPDGDIELVDDPDKPKRPRVRTPNPDKEKAIADLTKALEFTGRTDNIRDISTRTIAEIKNYTYVVWNLFYAKCEKELLDMERVFEETPHEIF